MRWGNGTLPEHVKESPWFRTLSAGARNILEFSYAEHPQHMVLRDVSQSPGRIRYSEIQG